MGKETAGTQTGFSLVELMVAITITVIVTGAIYGLVTAGGNAFRREPEIADRQQSIRVAMDSISRDVLVAGQGLPTVRPGLHHRRLRRRPLRGRPQRMRPRRVPWAPPTATARGGTDVVDTDVLEMLGAEETCPALRVC